MYEIGHFDPIYEHVLSIKKCENTKELRKGGIK